jgi:hypothetical protein
MLALTNDQVIGSALNGHMNAERSLGVPAERRIDLPADRTADGAMDAVFERLGRPNAATEYKFADADPGGEDKAAVDFLQGALFKAGVSGDAASQFFSDMKTWISGIDEATANEAGITRTANEGDLQREWGSTHEGNVNLAKAAAAKLGVEAAAFDAIQDAIGHSETMKLFHTIGTGFGEDAFISGDGKGTAALTPEGAKAQIDTLKKDEGFRKRLSEGDVAANKQWKDLMTVWSSGPATK